MSNKRTVSDTAVVSEPKRAPAAVAAQVEDDYSDGEEWVRFVPPSVLAQPGSAAADALKKAAAHPVATNKRRGIKLAEPTENVTRPEEPTIAPSSALKLKEPAAKKQAAKAAPSAAAAPVDSLAQFAAPRGSVALLSSSSPSSSSSASSTAAGFASSKQVESAMGARDRRAATAAKDGAFRSEKHQTGLAGIESTGLFLNSFPLSSIVDLFKNELPPGASTIAPVGEANFADGSSSASAAGGGLSSSAHAQIEPFHQDLKRFNTGLDKFVSGGMAKRAYEMQQKAFQMHGPPVSEYRYPITSQHVRDSLRAPHSELSMCNSANCTGLYFEKGFTMVEYLKPAQLEHFHRTRKPPIPSERVGMCYPCMLRLSGTQVGLAASGQFAANVYIEFYHMVNMPGGYVPEAMDVNAMSGHCAGVVTPLRRLTVSEYVYQPAEMYVLKRDSALGGDGQMSWVKQEVKGYAERADLIYGAAPCPSPPNANNATMAVAYSKLPSCEDLIFNAMVGKSKLIRRSAYELCVAQETSVSMGGWQIKLRDFFGGEVLMPEWVDVCSPAATTQEMIWSLIFADPAVALARLVAMVVSSGGNMSVVLDRMSLNLAGLEFLRLGGDTRSRFQASKPFGDHLLFYLMCARLNETSRLLSHEVPPVETGGDVLNPSGSVVALMANHGIKRRIADYHYAMRPIISYYTRAMSSQQSFDDAKMFQTNPVSGLLLYIELRPMPAPTYFEAIDLVQNPPIKEAVHTEKPLVMINSLLGSMESLVDFVSKKRQQPGHDLSGDWPGYGQLRSTLFCPFEITVANIDEAEEEFLSHVPLLWIPEVPQYPLGLGWDIESMLYVPAPKKAYEHETCLADFVIEPNHPYTDMPPSRPMFADELIREVDNNINPSRRRNITVWRALILRVNAGMLLLNRLVEAMNGVDGELYQLHENPGAWMKENWEANLAAMLHEKGGVFQTAHTRLGVVDFRRDIAPLMASMQPIDPEALECYARRRELSRGAQAVKRFLSGHLETIAVLIRNQCVEDGACIAAMDLCPVTDFGEGAMCIENMEATAARLENVDFLFPNPNCRQTLFEWTMAHVRPASVHIMDFVSRIHTAISSSQQYASFVFECLTATLCGLYPHAREIGSFNTWLDCHWWRQAAAPNQMRALDAYLSVYGTTAAGAARAEAEERLLFVALRERFVYDCQLALGLQLHILCQYDAQPQFENSVISHCDRIRQSLRELAGPEENDDDETSGGGGGGGAGDDDYSSMCIGVENSVTLAMANEQAKLNSLGMMQTWHTFHQASTNAFDFLSTCFGQVDLLVVVNECIKQGRSLPVEHFKPPEDLLRYIGDYILENVPTYGQFEKHWLIDMGVSARAARFMAMTVEQHRSGSLTSASGQAAIQQLFRFEEFDYALCSAIFHLLATHRRNRIIPLDADTAIRQCRAIAERPELAISQSSCHCIVSSMQCCNTLKTLVVQTHGCCTGSDPTRYNFTTGEHMCRAGKTGQYTSARNAEKVGARSTIPDAFRNYNRCKAQALISPEIAIANEGELREAEAALRAALRVYAQTVAKGRLRIPCDSSYVRLYPVVGYAFEQHSSQTESVSCTVCPMCGNKTRFNTRLFGVNGFSCGHCQPYIAEEFAELTQPRCALCALTIAECDQASKASGIDKDMRQWTTERTVIDDISVPGMSFPRSVLICSVCNVQWLREAYTALPLSEIKYWLEHSVEADSLLTNIVEMPQLDTYVTELELLRDQLSRPMPKIGKATDLQKAVTIRTGLGSYRFNVPLAAIKKPMAPIVGRKRG